MTTTRTETADTVVQLDTEIDTTQNCKDSCKRLMRLPTEGLYVYNYSDESRQLSHSLEYKEFLSRDDFRKMQQFTVQVYKHFIIQNGVMCKTMPQGFMVWYGNYDPETGISVTPIEADKLVV